MDNALMKDAGTGTVLDPTGVVVPELSRWPSGVLATFAVSAPASGAARVCVRPSRMDSARLCSSEASSLLLPLGSPSDWSVDGRSLELEDDEADMALAWKSSGSRTTPERRPLWRKRENRLFLTSVGSGMPGVEARDGGPFDRLKSEPLRVVCMTSMCWASPILQEVVVGAGVPFLPLCCVKYPWTTKLRGSVGAIRGQKVANISTSNPRAYDIWHIWHCASHRCCAVAGALTALLSCYQRPQGRLRGQGLQRDPSSAYALFRAHHARTTLLEPLVMQ